ncbi:MAG: DUF4384 domain-containing protein [Planctomycetes bacterium]|nr:DUF4384 domain-containing protein [Planctomycetota bacterium]
MKFSIRRAVAACLILGFLAAWAAPRTALSQESRVRDLVRKYVKEKKHDELAKLVGFSSSVEHVVALDYTVLVRADGVETAVDPMKYEFTVGDQIRVRIEPVNDAYIYIFHQGASGHRTCLLPTEQEKPPKVTGGQPLDLPDDGYFEFVAPPGSEELLVVATEEPAADLALLSNVVFAKPEDELTEEEKKLKATLQKTVQKTLQSIQTRSRRTRAAFSEEVVREAMRGQTRGILEEPPTGNEKSSFAMAVSTERGDLLRLYVKIPLKSIASER